jgi:hypothetical protein
MNTFQGAQGPTAGPLTPSGGYVYLTQRVLGWSPELFVGMVVRCNPGTLVEVLGLDNYTWLPYPGNPGEGWFRIIRGRYTACRLTTSGDVYVTAMKDWMTAGVGENPLAPERHALQLDGVVDRMYAPGVRAGTGTQYTLITKVSSVPASGADNYISMLSVPSNTNGTGGNLSDGMTRRLVGSQMYYITGLTSVSTGNYARRSDADAVTAVNTAAIYMIGRDLTANTARGRVVGADGVVRWNPVDIATVQDSQPLDLVIGCAANHLFVPFAGTFYAIRWVASLLLRIIPTDARLQAYAQGSDARLVFTPAEIEWYATASRLLGEGSGPIVPVVGSAHLTLAGPTSADLVTL